MENRTICHIASMLNLELASAKQQMLDAVENGARSSDIQNACDNYKRAFDIVNGFRKCCYGEAKS